METVELGLALFLAVAAMGALALNEQTLRAIEAEIDHAETLVAGVPRSGH